MSLLVRYGDTLGPGEYSGLGVLELPAEPGPVPPFFGAELVELAISAHACQASFIVKPELRGAGDSGALVSSLTAHH